MKYSTIELEPENLGTGFISNQKYTERESSFSEILSFNDFYEANIVFEKVDFTKISDDAVRSNIKKFFEYLSKLIENNIQPEEAARFPKLNLDEAEDGAYSLRWQTMTCISEFIIDKQWEDSFWVLTGKRDGINFSKSGGLSPNTFSKASMEVLKEIIQDV